MAADPPGLIEVRAFSGANSRAYLSAVFAAYRDGVVVLALPPGSGSKTVPGTRVQERKTFDDDPGWFDESLELITSDDPAQIAFSSGTTGRPKALLLTHRALSDVVVRINDAMGVDDSIREYIGVPVTFSFGFGRARAVAAAGGKSYLPKNGFDPAEIARMAKAGEINAISAVPTLWRVVLANPDVIGEAGATIRWIEIGSQYMAADEKEGLKNLFPNAKIVQHYGLTEASRTTLLDISSTKGGALESVGQTTGEVEIALNEEGVIRTRGPHLALGLVSGAGIKPFTDADGWLTTSDRGRIEDGYLYYEGRTDELINSGGLKIDPTQFEQKLSAALGVSDAVAVGRLPDDLRGEKVLIVTQQAAGLKRTDIEAAAQKIATDLGLTGSGSFALRDVAEIPRTATGKVQRAKLADLPDIGALEAAAEQSTARPTEQGMGKAEELQALWAEVLGIDHVALNQSFYDLGGDSLSALTVIMRMEALGLEPEIARGIFDGKTIAEITGVSAEPISEASHPDVSTQSVSASADPRAAELQAMWAEVLGVEDVALDQSFYDLGGDSLSALTVIMRMEALGLDPETARGIFDGKTIAEITGTSSAPADRAPSQDTPTPSASTTNNPRAVQLQTLWAEVLGVENVALDQSFYDLGGDSLSALTVIMRMEALGLEPEIARGIFDGKTIADLAGVDTDPAPVAQPAPETSPETSAAPVTPTDTAKDGITLNLAEAMNSVHATRGVLVLWVVMVHWLPGVLARLTDNAVSIYESLIPALRFGTPGFAMVFGMGLGALGIAQYTRSKAQFLKGSRFNTRLIVAGVLIYAAVKFAMLWSAGRLGEPLLPSVLFYSAITYYALAMLSLPVILWVLTRGSNRMLTILATAVACMIIHEVLFAAIAHTKPGGILELFKVLLTAKYGFFRMSGFVMIGVAIGYMYRAHHKTPGIAQHLALAGVTSISFGFFTLYKVQPEVFMDGFGRVLPWHLMIYAGAALLILSGFSVLNRAGGAAVSRPLQTLNAFAIASGILALPIFVGHEIVIPAKDLLTNLGLPEGLALIAMLGLFLGALGWGYIRLFRFLLR